MAFNDGDPIDAAQLGALETSLAEIKSKIPQFGSSTTNVSIDNRSIETVVVPQIFGGMSGKVTLKPGSTSTFTINYAGAKLTAAPKSILLTPVRETGMYSMQAHVVPSQVGPDKALCKVFHPSTSTGGDTYFYFLVIQHS
jgi:hypothetical protein